MSDRSERKRAMNEFQRLSLFVDQRKSFENLKLLKEIQSILYREVLMIVFNVLLRSKRSIGIDKTNEKKMFTKFHLRTVHKNERLRRKRDEFSIDHEERDVKKMVVEMESPMIEQWKCKDSKFVDLLAKMRTYFSLSNVNIF